MSYWFEEQRIPDVVYLVLCYAGIKVAIKPPPLAATCCHLDTYPPTLILLLYFNHSSLDRRVPAVPNGASVRIKTNKGALCRRAAVPVLHRREIEKIHRPF